MSVAPSDLQPALRGLDDPDGEISRVIRQVVRRELAASPSGAAHVDDVAADVRLRLIRRLARDPDGPVENVAAYAATAAERACHSFLRAQFPERTRFRNRLRYAASHHPSVRLEQGADDVWRCASARPARRAPIPGAAMAFIDDPSGWLARHAVDAQQPLPALVDAVVAALDRPIDFDRLVDALAAARGVVDVPARSIDHEPFGLELLDPAPAIADVLEARETLVAVWTEVAELPARQRAALLLNLRDPEGGGAILHLLPGTGIADREAIARAVGLGAGQLAALWDALPLDDLTIADRLGLTRQQVINLRKSARARLARRLRPSS